MNPGEHDHIDGFDNSDESAVFEAMIRGYQREEEVTDGWDPAPRPNILDDIPTSPPGHVSNMGNVFDRLEAERRAREKDGA